MKLITELTEDVRYLIEESSDGKKNLFIEGIFMQAGIPNRNKRIYNPEILGKEVARYINEKVKSNTAYGELGHPNGPSINLDRTSHLIKEIRQDGNNFIGKALIMETPMGNIVKGIINSGGKLGVSSRGMGSLKPNKQGIMEVQSDFFLATAADIVADPSGPNCWIDGIMESKEWIWDNGILKEVELSAMKEEIESNVRSRSLDEEKTLQLFENFLNKLSQN